MAPNVPQPFIDQAPRAVIPVQEPSPQPAGRAMGIGFHGNACYRKKNRFLFFIGNQGPAPWGGLFDTPAVVDDGVNALPPSKGARPSLTFKETECAHLNETIFFPTKPDWKPINLVLYDIRKTNPVFEWVQKLYDPSPFGQGSWGPSCNNGFKKTATLNLYDGCGNMIEQWVFENAYPQVAEFGDLDMGGNEIVTIDITLRYDRAYIVSDELVAHKISAVPPGGAVLNLDNDVGGFSNSNPQANRPNVNPTPKWRPLGGRLGSI